MPQEGKEQSVNFYKEFLVSCSPSVGFSLHRCRLFTTTVTAWQSTADCIPWREHMKLRARPGFGHLCGREWRECGHRLTLGE